MNVRKPLSVLVFAALAAPLAAFADAPSGDFYETHCVSMKKDSDDRAEAWKNDRHEYRANAEFSVEELVAGGSSKSREDVKRELAANPMPSIEA
jgi:hypothetical protein